MQSRLINSVRLSDKLKKVNNVSLTKQFRTLVLFTNKSSNRSTNRQLAYRSIDCSSSNLLTTTNRFLVHVNHHSSNSEEPKFIQLSIDGLDESSANRTTDSDFYLNEQFNSTELSIVQPPTITVKRFYGKRTTRSKMSLESPGQSKWHLKNVFFLLKNNCADEEDEGPRKFKNLNRFNVLTDFRQKGDHVWCCAITIFHPTKQTFEAFSKRKQEAEDNASYSAIQWLKEQGDHTLFSISN